MTLQRITKAIKESVDAAYMVRYQWRGKNFVEFDVQTESGDVFTIYVRPISDWGYGEQGAHRLVDDDDLDHALSELLYRHDRDGFDRLHLYVLKPDYLNHRNTKLEVA